MAKLNAFAAAAALVASVIVPAGARPCRMPWRAATNPAAQQNAAPVPHATPSRSEDGCNAAALIGSADLMARELCRLGRVGHASRRHAWQSCARNSMVAAETISAANPKFALPLP